MVRHVIQIQSNALSFIMSFYIDLYICLTFEKTFDGVFNIQCIYSDLPTLF